MYTYFRKIIFIAVLMVFLASSRAFCLAPWLDAQNNRADVGSSGVGVAYMNSRITTPKTISRPKGLSEEEMYYFEKSGQPLPEQGTWYEGKNFVYAKSGQLMEDLGGFTGFELKDWSVPVAYLLENILQHNYNYVFSPSDEILVDAVRVEKLVALRLTGPVFDNIHVPFTLNAPLTVYLARQIQMLKRQGALSPNTDAGAALTFVSDRFKKYPGSFLYYREQPRLINGKTVDCVETILVMDMDMLAVESVPERQLGQMYQNRIEMFNRCFDSRNFTATQIARSA